MRRKKFIDCLWIAFPIALFASSTSWGEDQEVQTLRQEVRELKSTVRELTDLVKQQNQRIDSLEGRRAGPATPETKERPLPSTPPLRLEPATPIGSVEAAKPGSDQEMESLLATINTAPASPGADAKSFGFWKVPTGQGMAWKLIPDISVIATFSGAYFSMEPTGDVGHDPARTGFTFQELELGLQAVIDPYFRYDVFLSFHEEGVELEEAYFTTLWGPRGLQFKGGKMLLPFGRQNPKHLEQWAFADNMLVNKYLLGPEGLGELGLEMSYLFPTPFFMQIQGTFTNGSNDTSFGGTGKGDFLYQGRYSTSVDITEDLTMLLGFSGAFGTNSSGSGNRTEIYGGDFLLKWKPSARSSLTWQTEYIFRRMQLPGDNQSDGGLYSYIDYQFLKRWHAGLRGDLMGIPEGLILAEYRITPAITFDPTEFSRIRLQYEYDKIRGISGSSAAILEFEFSMGPHGGHPF